MTYWIPAHLDLGRHPKTKKLARALGCKLPCAVGHLFYLWWWAMEYAPDGDLSRYDDADIADGAQWEGDSSELVTALIDTGWLNPDRALHDWNEYGGRVHEEHQRRAERARQARARQSPPTPPDDPAPSPPRDGHVPVTETARAPLEKKRREENRGDVGATHHAGRAADAAADVEPPIAPPAPEPEPPTNVMPLRAVPKPNRYGEVLDALKARGIDYKGSSRDAKAVKDCAAAPALIAEAYAAAAAGHWGGSVVLDNLSIWAVCPRIAAYQASKAGVRARPQWNGSRAPIPGELSLDDLKEIGWGKGAG